MMILAIVLSYAVAGMVGAVVTAAVFRAKTRKQYARRGRYIRNRERALRLNRELEQSVVKLSRPMKRAGITGVTIYKGETEDFEKILPELRWREEQ